MDIYSTTFPLTILTSLVSWKWSKRRNYNTTHKLMHTHKSIFFFLISLMFFMRYMHVLLHAPSISKLWHVKLVHVCLHFGWSQSGVWINFLILPTWYRATNLFLCLSTGLQVLLSLLRCLIDLNVMGVRSGIWVTWLVFILPARKGFKVWY